MSDPTSSNSAPDAPLAQRVARAALSAVGEGAVVVSRDGVEALNPVGVELLQALGPAVLRARADAGGGETLRHGERSFTVSVRQVEGLEGAVVVLREIDAARAALREEILRVSGREQRRIGQNLHDGLCQQLVGISFLAQGVAAQTAGTPAGAIATEMVNLLSVAAEDTRRLAKGLCPVALETSGLGSALEELAASFRQMYPAVEIRVDREEEVLGPRDPVATHLYHVAQEALSNAVKHGAPSSIAIGLVRSGGRITLTIQNDGAPFVEPTPETSGMGLRSMRYRAQMLGAELEVSAVGEGGARVVCRLEREEEP